MSIKKNAVKYVVAFFVFALVLSLVACGNSAEASETTVSIYDSPITTFTSFWDIFVYPVAALMWLLGKTIAFGYYGLVIVFATLIVRTIAWPIYAKSNDMTLKMQLAQPELDKINLKYQGKEDEQSKQRMQMETMAVYKKYGIGIGGCLMPLVQMPIFIGFYQAVSRVPATLAVEGGSWLTGAITSTTLFGVDLTVALSSDAATTKEKVLIYVLAGLVGVTQVVSVILSQRRQKRQREQQQANVPEYRRLQQSDQQKQTSNMMNIMMYGMAVMMVFFVIRRPAGLGIYWLVGNIYSTIQTAIGQKNTTKRLEKLRKKANGGR